MSQNGFMDGLGYEGKVTLTLKSNNRVLKSQTYKNKGTARLFKFLGHCLAGAYGEAQGYLPTQIVLLYNGAGSGLTSTATEDNVTQRSSWISYAQTPTIISDDTLEQVRVVYSFEVTKAAVTGEFNQVALYGVNASDITEFSAYYYLTDPENPGNFFLQSINDWSASTVLLIDWELIISNKNVENN